MRRILLLHFPGSIKAQLCWPINISSASNTFVYNFRSTLVLQVLCFLYSRRAVSHMEPFHSMNSSSAVSLSDASRIIKTTTITDECPDMEQVLEPELWRIYTARPSLQAVLSAYRPCLSAFVRVATDSGLHTLGKMIHPSAPYLVRLVLRDCLLHKGGGDMLQLVYQIFWSPSWAVYTVAASSSTTPACRGTSPRYILGLSKQYVRKCGLQNFTVHSYLPQPKSRLSSSG